MAAVAIPTRHWTREEYDRLIAEGFFGPDERLELINGEIVQMSPQGSTHATAVRLVEEALRKVFREGCDVRVQMPLALGGQSEPEPNVAVVVGSPRNYKDAHPHTALLVVEVADSTLDYDRTVKTSLYAGARIQEYWVLNLLDRTLEIYLTIQERQIGNLEYQTTLVKAASEDVTPLAQPNTPIPIGDLLP